MWKSVHNVLPWEKVFTNTNMLSVVVVNFSSPYIFEFEGAFQAIQGTRDRQVMDKRPIHGKHYDRATPAIKT